MTRRHGDGSLFKDGQGRWVAQLTIGKTPDGRRIRATRHRQTRSDALKALQQLREQRSLSRSTKSDTLTFGQFAEDWLNLHAESTCRPSTVSGYRDLLYRYVRGYIWHMRLRDIDVQDVAAVLRQLGAAGLSTTTIRRVRALIGRVLQVALEQRIININVARLVPVPKPTYPAAPTRVQEPLTKVEALNLLKTLRGHPLHPIVVLALFTGMRRGEILGLRWSDIDDQAGRLQVQRTLREGRTYHPDGSWTTGIIENPPKTRNSRRAIPMSSQVRDALHQQRVLQSQQRLKAGTEWVDHGYVFTTDTGRPTNPNGIGKKFSAFLKRHELRHIRFHDLRHTTAVLMLEASAPLEEVSQALGHASISITKDVYASYVPQLADRAIEALAGFLASDTGPERRLATR